MQINNTQIPQFTEQDMMTDLLSSEKFITANYSSFANECATPALVSDFINILSEEHRIQNDVFNEMQRRGWYPTEAADQNKINQTKQKYQG